MDDMRNLRYSEDSVFMPVYYEDGFVLRWYLVPFNGLQLQVSVAPTMPDIWPTPHGGSKEDVLKWDGYCYRVESTIFCWVKAPLLSCLNLYTARDLVATMNHELLHAVLKLALDITSDVSTAEEPMAYVISYVDRAVYDVLMMALTRHHPEFKSPDAAAKWWGAEFRWVGQVGAVLTAEGGEP